MSKHFVPIHIEETARELLRKTKGVKSYSEFIKSLMDSKYGDSI